MIQIPVDLEVEETNIPVDAELAQEFSSSSYKLIYHQERYFPLSRQAAGATGLMGSVAIPAKYFTSDKMLYVKIRDVGEKTPGCWFGSDTFVINENLANGEREPLINKIFRKCYYIDLENKIRTKEGVAGAIGGTGLNYSVPFGYYPYKLSFSVSADEPIFIFVAKRDDTFMFKDSTYTVDIYLLDWPGDISPFER